MVNPLWVAYARGLRLAVGVSAGMTASTIATEVVAAQIAGLDAEIARIDEQVANLKDRREGVVLIKEALLPLVAHVSHRHVTGTGTGAIGAPAVMVASANGRVSVTGLFFDPLST